MTDRIPLIVFTGAGASRAEPIKLPTMAEFFDEIMDGNRVPLTERITNKQYFKFVMDSIYGEDKNYDLERVMGALYGVADFTNNDCWKIFQNPMLYENIMTALRSSFGESNFNANGRTHNINNAKEIILNATDRTYGQYKKDAELLIFQLENVIREKYSVIPNESLRKVYEPFFNILIDDIMKVGSNVLPIFTINYDMSIDWFFESEEQCGRDLHTVWSNTKRRKIRFIDGFINNGRSLEWNQDEYKKINNKITDNIYIPYFKLHGSLFWEEVYGKIRRGINVLNDSHSPKKLKLLYPSYKDRVVEEPYYFNQRQFEIYLNNTDIMVVIGFSFRDPEIVKAIDSALLINDTLRILIVCPDDEDKYFPDMFSFIKRNQDKITVMKGYFGNDDIFNSLPMQIETLHGPGF